MDWQLDELDHLSVKQELVDVRTPKECTQGMIPGAVNIPLDALSGSLGKFSKNKEYLIYCHAGVRGESACRILAKGGIKCRNLAGGYLKFLENRKN
ncbi:MAG: rhodanese-like domain-containing protein [Candidatus Omnitrophota bacterium]